MEPRLAELLSHHREEVARRLAEELEWAADPGDRRRLIRDPEVVRPRVEVFLDCLLAGLAHGDWAMFATLIAEPTGEVLRAGIRSAQELNERAMAIVAMLIPYVSSEDDRDQLLVALFRTMQGLSSSIVAGHHEHLLQESRRLNELKSLFMRLTSHELRNPLTVTRGYASLLVEGDFGQLPGSATDAAGLIVTASESALSLINGLSEVASLDEEAGVLKVASVHVGELVDRAVDDVMAEAAARGVRIERHVDEGLLEVDPERCVIAVRNLLANAVKYGGRDGTVHVRAWVNGGDHAEIAVEDEGPGIPDEEREAIFERYYRSKASRASGIPGSGLGLYIVRRIAQLHGGDVRVSSELGRGTCFTLSIPVTSAH